MKSRYKFMSIILIMIIVASITFGCRKKTEEPQPPVGESPIVDHRDGNDNDEQQDQEEKPDQQSAEEDQGKEGKTGQADSTVVTLENELGQEVIIEKPKDKLLVMTFWVDWNQTAKDQLKVLENLYPLLKDNVDFVGIHALGFDSISKGEAQEKIKAKEYSYPMLIDEKSIAQQKYYVGSFPTTVLVDQEGNVVKSLTTAIEEDELLEEIETILEKFLP